MKEKLEQLLAELNKEKADSLNSKNIHRKEPLNLQYFAGKYTAFSLCINMLEEILK